MEIDDLIVKALESGTSSDVVSRLLDWRKEEGDRANKAEFLRARGLFKKSPPKLVKGRHVKHKYADYWHLKLDDLVEIVSPALSDVGLDFFWRTKVDEGLVYVTCVLAHERGHSEENTLVGEPDTTGSKNSVQAIGSTVTYLERYTLLAVLGLAASDADDDGGGPAPDTISAEQVATINDLLAKSGANEAAMLKWLKADSVESIHADRYDEVVTMLQRKVGAK